MMLRPRKIQKLLMFVLFAVATFGQPLFLQALEVALEIWMEFTTALMVVRLLF